ncbi:MAG: hypothetical protein HeimC2_28750 [Candidatus Heimdallarchaeota archaeon LC_2]|nr:MAG: hypothetical protein HeimC2_28750 [Candidatus Heimdallarchaeota archaeon LC_2]
MLLLFSITIGSTQAHVTKGNEDYLFADDHCDDPEFEITIAAIGPSSFDRNLIEVPANTCMTIWFINSINIAHNFVIEYVERPEFHSVYMDLANSSAVCGQASSDHADTPGKARFNILTPKYYSELEFYCGYPGHYDAGMKGIIKVLGEKLPDNTVIGIAIALIMIILFALAFMVHKRITKSFLK